MNQNRRRAVRAGAALVAVAVPVALAAPVSADGRAHPQAVKKLVKAVSAEGVAEHLRALQKIADDNGGTRAAGTPGYDASRDYVIDELRGAGYSVHTTDVEFPTGWEELATPVLSRVSPDPTDYTAGTDFVTVISTGSGDVTAQIQVVDPVLPPGAEPNTATSGCEPEDFDGFVAGRIAVIQRGTCPFITKAENAKAAGAAAVIFFNEGQEGRTEPFQFDILEWRLGFPVLFASFETGVDLVGTPGATVHVSTSTRIHLGHTTNVIADSPYGRADNVVMVGAHLDSVPEGPGINDNGSGAATLIEVAQELAKIKTNNRVRFAFWGAEELGLLGSDQYVEGLSAAERAKIALYLNFDMIASPNYAYMIYDGDDSDAEGAGPGPDGSAAIEELFEAYYDSRGLAHIGTDFDGRSDYGPFIEVGIPSGGLFTGAEDPKTPEQVEMFGGTAGVAYDVCYHQACDTIDNVNMTALDVNADAVATATATYALSTATLNAG